MSIYRLCVAIALLVVLLYGVWRLQKFKRVRVVTRIILLPGVIAVALHGLISTTIVNRASSGKLYDEATRVPAREAALVLGVNKMTAPMIFSNRIDAAAAVFGAGRVHMIVVSGSSSPGGADEASDMRSALVARGIPESAIRMDANGTNTFASLHNYKVRYPSQSIMIVSQRYHVARGIYMASKMGMESVGFSLGYVGRISSPREFLARIKAVFVTRYE